MTKNPAKAHAKKVAGTFAAKVPATFLETRGTVELGIENPRLVALADAGQPIGFTVDIHRCGKGVEQAWIGCGSPDN